jgi:hypothetical protein
VKITAIRLQNFMGFVDTKWIELRPITLLFGRNSSGKSAVIRALLLLRQSLQSERSEPLAFFAEHGIDLGSFWRMIHGREFYDRLPNKEKDYPGVLRQMVFGFRVRIDPAVLRDFRENYSDPEASVELSLNYQWNDKHKRSELSAVTIEAPFSADEANAERRQIFQAELIEVNERQKWYFSSCFYEYEDLHYPDNHKKPDPLKVWQPYFQLQKGAGFLPALKVIESSDADNNAPGAIKNLLELCCEAVGRLLRDSSFRYLGPIRYAPRRTYLLSDLSQHKWDAAGQAAISDFLKSDGEESEKRAKLSNWFDKLGIGEELKAIPLPSLDQNAPTEAFQISVAESERLREVNLRDVGYGASQVLPIVLQALSAPEESLVIIEQPELHLHPEAQAELIDLFISQASKTRRFLVETHSEHMLLRMQLRIAGGEPRHLLSDGDDIEERYELKGSDCGLVFVTRANGTGVSDARYIQADPFGRLVNTPAEFKGFFSRDYLDSSEFTLAVSRNLSAKPAKLEKPNEIGD